MTVEDATLSGSGFSCASPVRSRTTEEMERILNELEEVGLTLKKTEGGDYILKEKEEK